MQNNILLSIIIPLYNSEKVIEGTIGNLLSSSFLNDECEILLIDDGSKDNTECICKRIISNYSRHHISYYKRENQGISKTRNFGLLMARGKYVFFHDHDDKFESIKLLEIIDLLKNTSFDLYVFGANRIIDNLVTPYISIRYTPNDSASIVEQLLKACFKVGQNDGFINHFGSVWSNIYSKKFLDENKIKFKHLIHYEDDFNFLVDLLLNKPKVFVCQYAIYNWVINKGSTSRSFTVDISFLNKIKDYEFYLNNLIPDSFVWKHEGINNCLWCYYRDFIVYYCKRNNNSNIKEFLSICKKHQIRKRIICAPSFKKTRSQKFLIFLFKYRMIRLFYYLYKYIY